MSDSSQGPGWWQASDGKWYAPELHPDYVAPATPPAEPPAAESPAAEPPAAEPPAAEPPAAEPGLAAEPSEPTEATPATEPIAATPADVAPAPIEPPPADTTQTFIPPPPGEVPPPPMGPPPIGLPPTGPPGEGKASNKKPLIIALVVIAVLALAGAAFALTRGGDDKSVATKTDSSDSSSSKKSSDSDSSSSKKTTTTKKPTTTTEPPTKKANLTIVTGGASNTDDSGNHYATAGAALTNPDTKLAAYNIKVVFNMVDAAGTVIDTESSTVDYIGPGKTVFVAPSYFSVKSDVSKVDVQAVGDLKPDKGYAGADYTSFKGIPLTVVDAALVPDAYSPSITVHVSNPGTAVAENGQLTCLLFAGPNIAGGTTTYLDTVVPGGTIQADAYLDFIPAGVDSVQCQAIA